MRLPPISVSMGPNVKEALHHHLQIDCVERVVYDERCAYVTFKDVFKTHTMVKFMSQLGSNEFTIQYENQIYRITSLYLDI